MKKRGICKLAGICLALVTLLPVFATGCASGSGQEDTAVDLGGYEFVLASHWDEYNQERGVSAFGDALLDKYAEIEEKYNCKITFKTYLNAETIASEVHAEILAGDKPFDILDAPIHTFYSLFTSDDLYNQSELQDLNLSDDRFNQAVNTIGTWSQKTYGSWFGYTDNVPGMYYNKKLLTDQSQEDPYQLYLDGKWTFDKLTEMLRSTTFTTDAGSRQYGIVMGNAMTEYFLHAGGGGLVIGEGDATPTFALDKAESMSVVNILKNWKAEKLIHPQNHYDGVKKPFAEGQAAFIPTLFWSCESFADMEDEFGFVPFPTVDGSKDVTMYVDEARMYLMPKNLTNPQATAVIYNALATLGETRKTLLEQEYTDQGCSPEMIDCFRTLEAQVQREPNAGADLSVAEQAYYDSWQNANVEPASKFASIKTLTQNLVNDFYGSLPK